MTKKFLFLFLLLSYFGYGQVTTVPDKPVADQPVTITVDVTGTVLAGYTSDVWIWTWIEATVDINAPTNVDPATDNQSAALMSRSSTNANIYSITFTPTDFFDKPAETFNQIGLLLKGRSWNDGKTPDYQFDVLSGQFEIDFSLPAEFPVIVDLGQTIPIAAVTTETAAISLKIDNVEVASASEATVLNYTETALTNGLHQVKLTADNGTDIVTNEFYYTVRSATISEPRPSGVIEGINYHVDLTKVTLCLLAPMKSSIYAVGEFNNWIVDPAFQMKQDGEYFWIEITGLTSGQEYAYQYLVDESIWIADPYSDKILDLDDNWIPDTTYPNLKAYPEGALHSNWYENRTAVLQTNQIPYNWLNNSFKKPKKEKLVVYELLVRDFLGQENMNYQSLIDTLGYLKDLGVNAIELMPIMEFNGNDSWGYNPTFMFAVDKAYGSKNDLKEFIDTAHGMGMAVILDMVMNQNDIPSPYAQMYFDFEVFKPTAENPWFNVDAKHPFNVFFDINHESSYTQAWLDSINHYWVSEFHFDGYRFDLSKGFTQFTSGSNVGLWGQQDNSRIAILKRMADAIWSNNPETYVILEHFSDNSEEKILSDYGMMLWGNSTHEYGEANLGFGADQSLSWAYFKERGWSNNNLITYMESHDEERQVFKMEEFGNASRNYNIRDLTVALNRLKLSGAFFFTVPGPKMLWQWGEYGYNISIEENGRTGRKPAYWEYLDYPKNQNVLEVYKELIKLRTQYDVFTEGDFTWQPDGNYKSIHIAKADTNVVIIGNFDVVETEMIPEFQNTGTWYDFFSGEEFNVNDPNQLIPLNAGEFHIYTDKKLHNPEQGIITGLEDPSDRNLIGIYPNPTNEMVNIDLLNIFDIKSPRSWVIMDVFGREVSKGNFVNKRSVSIDVSGLPVGLYSLILEARNSSFQGKFIKK